MMRTGRGTRRGVVLAVMCVGMFLVQLDVTVVNVALPHVGAELRTGVAGLQWVVTGYAVVLAALLLTGGVLGDRRGHRRVVAVGLVVFGAASLGCAVAPVIGALVAARVLQGLGAALLLPGTLAIVTRVYSEPAERARALGIWTGTAALALPSGPLLGGVLIAALGWRAVFAVNVPIVATALAATLRWCPADAPGPGRTGRGRATGASVRANGASGPLRGRVGAGRGASVGGPDPADGGTKGRVDAPGAVCAAVALGALVYAVISAGSGGGGGAIVAGGVAVLALGAFVVVEGRVPEPMLPLRLLRSRAFTGANTVAGAMNFVGLGMNFVLGLYLQEVLGLSPVRTGAGLLPFFAPLALLAPVTGRITARFGPRPPMIAGLLVGAAGLVSLPLMPSGAGYAGLVPPMLGIGVGMGLLTAAVVTAAMSAVPPDRSGLASGVNNTARQAAGAIGVAVFGAVTGSPADAHAFTVGVHTIVLAAAALWLAAAALTAWTIPAKRTT